MTAEVSFRRKVPVRHEVDVFVAGGGPSGVAAAVAAARQGAAVFVAEAQGCFGGMGTAGLVPSFGQFSDGINFLAGGVGQEVYERCREAGVFGPEFNPDRKYRWDGNPFHCEGLKRVYDELVSESGVDFTFGTRVVAVEAEGGRLQCAICHAKSGLFAVRARAYVDCTGDGDLAVWAGAPFEQGDQRGNVQSGTLCSLWSGIDWRRARQAGLYDKWPLGQSRRLKEAVEDGVFTVPDLHHPGIWVTGSEQGGGNMGHAFGVDGTDERSVTEALVAERRKMPEYQRYYREYNPGFERIELAATGALLGIRETRRIIGDYVLTFEDYRRRATFPDEIGRHNNDVDVHAAYAGEKKPKELLELIRQSAYREGESYGIPYRCLLPQGLDDLLVAGRCISTDRYVNGSLRIMPACFITGQAAGVAAALAAAGGASTREVDVAEVRGRLREMGAYLPDAQ
ncbi:MAG: FAD-dependent oxidoreductase [Planctomycetota bacterium]|jgi:hypothetical protein